MANNDVKELVREVKKNHPNLKDRIRIAKTFQQVAAEIVADSGHLELSSFRSLRRGTRPGRN